MLLEAPLACLEVLEPARPLVVLVSWLGPLLVVLIAVLHAALHPLCYWRHRWEDLDQVTHPTLWVSDEAVALPVLGSFPSFLLGESSFQEDLGAVYRRHRAPRADRPPPAAVGLFEWRARPCVLVLDAVLVARVLGEDAGAFAGATDEQRRGLGGGVPPALRGRLSPLLRAGGVEAMACLMAECAEQLVQALAERAAAGPADMDVLGLLDRCSTAVVGACAFGVAGNCVQDPDCELHRVVRASRRPSPLSMLALALVTALPTAAALVPARVLFPAAASLYVDMLLETGAFRERTRTRRADFVNLMSSTTWCSADFLTGKDRRRHCALAYDVAAAQAYALPARAPRVLARCLRELALRPGLQSSVAQQVRAARAPGRPLDLQVVRGAPLLEQVLLETLRLEPACSVLCTEVGPAGYSLPVSRRGLPLEPSTRLYVAVSAAHQDPELYPEPQGFDPQRFSVEARLARPAGAFLPFGELPGTGDAPSWAASGLPAPATTTSALFALQEMALCLTALLTDLEFSVAPAERARGPDQVWLRVQRRCLDADADVS